jgi:hypothetical protein
LKDGTTRNRKDLGKRKHARVELYKRGFLIPAPEAPWIECLVVDVGHKGVRLDVGALPVAEMFGLAFTEGGEVLRVCSVVWRQGELVGARFVSPNELRQGVEPGAGSLPLRRRPRRPPKHRATARPTQRR